MRWLAPTSGVKLSVINNALSAEDMIQTLLRTGLRVNNLIAPKLISHVPSVN